MCVYHIIIVYTVYITVYNITGLHAYNFIVMLKVWSYSVGARDVPIMLA